MIKLIKYRIAIITLLFGVFGKALSSILGIQDLQVQYIGIACLIAFIINLLTSFLLKRTWKKKVRSVLQIISLLLFLMLIISIAFHIYYFQEHTFAYYGFKDEKSLYIKGDEYTRLGDSLKAAHPYAQDGDLLKCCLGGPQGASTLWVPSTITMNTLILLASYGCIIIFFSFLVSMLVEILSLKYPVTSMK